MTLKESLFKKAEEVFDLHARGMLTTLHKQIWGDVLNITERYKEVANINVYAHQNKCQVRFWSQNGVEWNVAIRPQIKSFDAILLKGNSYEETEFKTRNYIEKHSKFWKVKESV